jgi:hypothetical protein
MNLLIFFFCFRTGFRPNKGGRLIRLVREACALAKRCSPGNQKISIFNMWQLSTNFNYFFFNSLNLAYLLYLIKNGSTNEWRFVYYIEYILHYCQYMNPNNWNYIIYNMQWMHQSEITYEAFNHHTTIEFLLVCWCMLWWELMANEIIKLTNLEW